MHLDRLQGTGLRQYTCLLYIIDKGGEGGAFYCTQIKVRLGCELWVIYQHINLGPYMKTNFLRFQYVKLMKILWEILILF